MALEPTSAEIATLQESGKLGSVLDVIGLDPELRALVHVTLGSNDEAPTRIIAALPESEVSGRLRAATLGEADAPVALTPLQLGMMGSIWGVTQYATGKLKTAEQTLAEKERDHKRAIELAAASAPVGESAAAPDKVKMAKTGGLTFSLDTVIDQTSKVDVEVLDHDELTKCYKRYHNAVGSKAPGAPAVHPHPDEEPSGEQLSALKHIVDAGAAPTVDFAVFVPHPGRNKKQNLFAGTVLNASGAPQRVEIRGPDSLASWKASWQVFRTAAIMLDICSPSTLDDYSRHFTQLHTRYVSASPELWLLLYQCDVRFRTEQLERVRRRGEAEFAQLVATTPEGQPVLHPYVGTMPWDYCFAQASKEFAFWYNEFESKAVILAARMGSAAGAIHEVAPSANSVPHQLSLDVEPLVYPRAGTNPGATRRAAGRDRSRTPGPGASGAPAVPQTMPMHLNQFYTHNKQGIPLCSGFNGGTCTVSKAGRCAKDEAVTHQCSLCLQQHPAGSRGCPGYRPQSTRTRKGRGRGRGEGSGKAKGKGDGKYQ